MASNVLIANRALNKLGADRILLLTDDNKAARTLNGMFESVRDAELRRYRWKFSIKRIELVALVAEPLYGYSYQYPLPADYLGLVQLGEYYVRYNDKSQPPYSIESGKILTNFEAPLRVRYVSRVVDSTMFDPLFEELFACKLAMEACETLTQSESKFQRMADQYKFALSEAMRCDAIEKAPDELPWGSWLDAREDSGVRDRAESWTSYPSGYGV